MKTIPRARLRRRLAREVRTLDGLRLRTVEDAVRAMLALPERRQMHPPWQAAARLIAEGGDLGTITSQLELALLLEARLDCRFACEAQAGRLERHRVQAARRSAGQA